VDLSTVGNRRTGFYASQIGVLRVTLSYPLAPQRAGLESRVAAETRL